jgi:hypothetical protein
VAKNNFLTDKFSTTGSLAAVAYGSSELFYAVADQIRSNSVSKSLDAQLPSHLVLDFVNTKKLLKNAIFSTLDRHYSESEVFTDFIDIFCKNDLDEYSSCVSDKLLSIINRISDYNSSLVSILEDSLEEASSLFGYRSELDLNFAELAKTLATDLKKENYIVEDLDLILLIAANNPLTKVSSAPADTLVPLSEEARLGKNYKGADINLGTTSFTEYYSGKSAYSSNIYSLQNVVAQGYVGYPLAALLGESLLDNDSLEYYSVSIGVSSNNIEDPLYNMNLATIDIRS